MPGCPNCLFREFCCSIRTELVDDASLDDAEFIRDLRAFTSSLNVNDEDWHEYLADCYRDYRGWIADQDGNEVFLDTDEFERPSIREWFRDFCCVPCPDHITPRVRQEARERVRVLATIMKARFPAEAIMWGVRAANDNIAD